jgi:DNA-binding SARP family transcriptional activator
VPLSRHAPQRRGRVIRLLGPVQVELDGRPLVVDTRKAIALLAYLAVTARPATRESLAGLLWPESDGPAGRGALRRTLSVLSAALEGRGILVDRSTVALDGGWQVDVRRFREALAVARAHDHGPSEACSACLGALEEAATLDRGEFMAGFALRDSAAFEEWQLAEAESHRRELAGLLERLARIRSARGDMAEAIDAGRRWLELDPLHEPAHRLLMVTLARGGEQAAAISQYRACVRILDEELGVAPLDETTELYESIRAGRVAPDEPRAVVRAGLADERPAGSTPLVGRATQLDALAAAYRSIGPDGRLLVVEGEPGIGKTRLAHALAEQASGLGAAVLEGRAYAGESAIAFGPIAALVGGGLERSGAATRLAGLRPDVLAEAARVLPILASGPTRGVSGGRTVATGSVDAFGRARAIEAVAEVLTALAEGPAPGLLLVDDADWADASTIEVLSFIGRRLRGRPVALLVTWRPLDPRDVERRRLAAGAEREGLAIRVALDRLRRREVAALGAAVLGETVEPAFIDRLFAESEGLPLYVAEVLAASPSGRGAVPQGVLELLRSRIASVGEVAGQILAAASVVGRSFDFETVRAASGRSEEETVAGLEELARRGIVREVGAVDGDVRLDFTHGRLRDVAYESLGLLRRRLLHRRVADALRASPPADGQGSRWSRIAHHEAEAGRTREAADAHRMAAADARRMFANREARDHLEAALALGGATPGELHESLGEVLTLLGDYAAAMSHLEAAAAIAEPGRESTIEHALALIHARLGDGPRAASHVAAALDSTGRDAPTRTALLADRSAIAGRQGDVGAARVFGREALGLAEAAGDQAGVARACHVLAVLARGRGSLDEAVALLARALAAARGLSDPTLEVASLNTLALVRAETGDRTAAIGLIQEALALCERQGDRHRQAALENNLADLLRADGRRDEAMEHLKRAVAIFADIGGRPGVPEPEIWKLVEW